MTSNWTIGPLRPDHENAVEHLLDRAFGRDRHGRTAYRLRQGTQPVPGLCFVAEANEGAVLGSIQCWPVMLQGDSGQRPLTLLGPLGVDPDHQGIGIGRALLRAATAAADRLGLGLMMLIGDEDYYAPFGFMVGFSPEWALPGPFERARLLVRNPDGISLPSAGVVGPKPGL